MSKNTKASKSAVNTLPRIVFLVILQVKNANPNGDPSNENTPRQTIDGRGKITPVCIKRKIRDRLQEMGLAIYIVSNDRATDEYRSIIGRLFGNPEVAKAMETKDSDKIKAAVLKNYIDARAFGGVIPKKGSKKGDGLSVGIRGAVTINEVYSVDPINITMDEIVKSTNGEGEEGRSSDTFGGKIKYVDYGLYVIKGSVNPLFAEANGFTRDDWDHVKQALLHLCDNDESAARPAGSMAVKQAYVWEGDVTNNGLSRLFDSVKIVCRDGVDTPDRYEDYEITLVPTDGFVPEVISVD